MLNAVSRRLAGWKPYSLADNERFGPRVVRGNLVVEDEVPSDTYFDFGCDPECAVWLHGALFVNGFNVGRYHAAGPTKTLYIPGPLLKKGDNEVKFSFFVLNFVYCKNAFGNVYLD